MGQRVFDCRFEGREKQACCVEMRFVVLTIFPEFFNSPLSVGLLAKAIKKGVISVETVQLRDFTNDKHKSVDDTPFGGGPGMVMMVEPLVKAVESIKSREPVDKTVLLSPRGNRFDHVRACELARLNTVLLVCGRYEGVDERFIELGFVDEELSIGDFVLSGGETAALAVIEACSRMVPGVVGKEESVRNDSFYSTLLDYPHYTKPREFRGLCVPEVLLSGDHGKIAQWRRAQALKSTAKRRPDLLEKVELSPRDRELLES